MTPLSDLFQIAGGSVMGRDHRIAGSNNQDAFQWRQREDMLAAVVCDGCGGGGKDRLGGGHNEVGAQLAARTMVDLLCGHQWGYYDNADLAREAFTKFLEERVRLPILGHFHQLINHMIVDSMEYAAVLEQFFLFTIVGVLVTQSYTCIFRLGDGVYDLNGVTTRLEPERGNRPIYLAYGLLKTSLKLTAPHLLEFQIQEIFPTHELRSLIIGTDGLNDLVAAQTQVVPYQPSYYVGQVAQFAGDEYFENADAVRRRLTILNTSGQRVDWAKEQVVRYTGVLRDDTTLISIRRHPRAPAQAPLICALCGYEGSNLNMTTACPQCGSGRVVLLSMVEEIMLAEEGPDWRQKAFPRT